MEVESKEEEEEEKEEEESNDLFCLPIPVFVEEWRKYCEPWRQSLIVKILDRRQGFHFVKMRLEKL